MLLKPILLIMLAGITAIAPVMANDSTLEGADVEVYRIIQPKNLSAQSLLNNATSTAFKVTKNTAVHNLLTGKTGLLTGNFIVLAHSEQQLTELLATYNLTVVNQLPGSALAVVEAPEDVDLLLLRQQILDSGLVAELRLDVMESRFRQ